jgi:hypothetical protein
MKALVKNTVKSISKTPSIGFVEVIILALAIAILLIPLS